jgi:hypothetical protein
VLTSTAKASANSLLSMLQAYCPTIIRWVKTGLAQKFEDRPLL